VFDRELPRPHLRAVVVIDNGRLSMLPYVDLTRRLFAQVARRFHDITTYYFPQHDLRSRMDRASARAQPVVTEQGLLRKPETRVVIVGDAGDGPEELEWPHGASPRGAAATPAPAGTGSTPADRFPRTDLLNPIREEEWEATYGPRHPQPDRPNLPPCRT